MTDDNTIPATATTQAAASRAFGEDNRRRLLSRYFDEVGRIASGSAWEHVYRLLLWIDPTTGLAHCYESDKSQPGRPWYARSLAFHGWVAEQLGVAPGDLAESIDWLFAAAVEDLTLLATSVLEQRTRAAAEQRAPYAGQGFPEPGQDPELAQLVLDALERHLTEPPGPEVLRSLTQRIRAHVTQENKRKNLLGEGFEDVLGFILRLVPGITGGVHVRSPIEGLPGFHAPPAGARAEEVDLALVRPSGERVLISAKWSIRSDRERQFIVDFNNYDRLNAIDRSFGHVLVTNEFDPARLKRNCETRAGNAPLFNQVVHVNPDALLATYGASPQRSARDAVAHIASGRLTSLAAWLDSLAGS